MAITRGSRRAPSEAVGGVQPAKKKAIARSKGAKQKTTIPTNGASSSREEVVTSIEPTQERNADQLPTGPRGVVEIGDTSSSSDDDSQGIPPTSTRAAPDPYDFPATLRPSPDKRLTVHLSGRKRSVNEMSLQDSPTELKRRRKLPGIEPSASKAGRPSTSSARVKPSVLNVLNGLHHQTRSSQGIKKANFTIDIPRGRPKQGESSRQDVSLRSVLQTKIPEDTHLDAPPSAQPGVEKHARPSQAYIELALESDEGNASRGLSDSPAPRIPGVPSIEDDEGSHPESLLEPPTPQGKPSISRKSQARKPKTAFEDRSALEQAVPKGSAPRSEESEEAQPAQQVEEDSPAGHIRNLFRGDQSPQVRGTAGRQRSVSHDTAEESDVEVLDPLTNQATKTTKDDVQVEITLKKARSMVKVMGAGAWTGFKENWTVEILDEDMYFEPENPLALRCWGYLKRLRLVYRKAPRFPRLEEQIRYLHGKARITNKLIANIQSSVKDICTDMVEATDSDKEDLMSDLKTNIIPLLVLLLQGICFLGGTEQDRNNKAQVPDEGTFVPTTAKMLTHVVLWLSLVHGSFAKHTTRKLALSANSEETLPSESARLEAERQLKLGSSIASLQSELRRARADLEDQLTAESRKAERIKRMAELKRQKEETDEALLVKKEAQFEAFCRSTQELRKRDPVAEKWHKAMALENRRAEQRRLMLTQRSAAQEEDEYEADVFSSRMGSPQLGEGFSEFNYEGNNSTRERPLSTRHPTRQVPSRHEVEDWHEDEDEYEAPVAVPSTQAYDSFFSSWIYARMKAMNRNIGIETFEIWADVMGRAVAEVKKEVKTLKVLTRASAREHGERIPAWAEKPDPVP